MASTMLQALIDLRDAFDECHADGVCDDRDGTRDTPCPYCEAIKKASDEIEFQRWRETGRDVDDLGGALGADITEQNTGRVYADGGWIVRLDDEHAKNWGGRWWLILGNTEMISDDLGQLERELWDWDREMS